MFDRPPLLEEPFAQTLSGKKITAKAPSSCSHYNAIYESQLQKTIVLRTQPQQRGRMTQPFHCDLQTEVQRTKKLKDRITPQVNFFQESETEVEAGRGREERQRSWWRIDKNKSCMWKSCVCVCVRKV